MTTSATRRVRYSRRRAISRSMRASTSSTRVHSARIQGTSIVATTLVGMVLGMLIAHGYPDAPVEARALRSGLELTPYGMPEPGGGFTVGLQGAL